MSSIELKGSESLPAARSEDSRIIVFYSIAAIGIILVLYALSGSPEVYPASFELTTMVP